MTTSLAFVHQAHRFVTSTSACRELLNEMANLVQASGGALHPALTLFEAGGEFRVLCADPAADGHVLVSLPRNLLISIEGAIWSEDVTELRLLLPPPGLSAIQRDLLGLHIALYNAADKIPWVTSHHPRSALRNSPALVSAMRAVRPQFGDAWTSAADVFLSTRTYILEASSTGDPPERDGLVLLPMVDLINHHPKGTGLKVDEHAMRILVTRAQGTDECFVDYGGRRDVVDLALQYGYLDHDVHFARSVPVSVAVQGVGLLSVSDEHRIHRHPLDPPSIEVTDNGMTLSHLTFSQKYPERFHTSLDLAVRSVALSRGLAPGRAQHVADEAIDAVIASNLAALEGVLAAARSEPRSPATILVGEACARQGDIVRRVALGRPSRTGR